MARRQGGAGCRVGGLLFAVSLGLALAGVPARAQDERSAFEHQVVQEGQRLLQQKQYRALIELIKPWTPQLASSPESRDLTVLLAAAYLGDNNAFWAIRTLAPRSEAQPEDCTLRIWLVWAYLQVPQLERAREVLGHASCRQSGPQAARVSLLRALVAKAEGHEPAAAADLAQAWAAEMYPADRDALPALSQQIDPDQIPEISWKIDLRQGYSSNALLGSPTDPNANTRISDTTSGYYQLSGWFRLAPRQALPVRPALEGEVRSFQLQNPAISSQSYLSLSGRLGLYLGSRLPRLFVGWRPEYLRLVGGNLETTGANWYAGAHRGEAELELKPWLLAFAGGGRRDFRPMIRDRYELDGGLGGQGALFSRLSLLWAVSGRKHWADSGTYDVWGGTALANLFYDFSRGVQARAGATLAGDIYPHWRGYLDPNGSRGNRRDLFVKATAALWSPLVSGFRLGVLYEYSHRDSSAPLFTFSDHRASVLLTWAGATALSRPRVASSTPVADPAWDVGGSDGTIKERVQDYLREDERTLQRSCGCRE